MFFHIRYLFLKFISKYLYFLFFSKSHDLIYFNIFVFFDMRSVFSSAGDKNFSLLFLIILVTTSGRISHTLRCA